MLPVLHHDSLLQSNPPTPPVLESPTAPSVGLRVAAAKRVWATLAKLRNMNFMNETVAVHKGYCLWLQAVFKKTKGKFKLFKPPPIS
jgi:hypothetical protein